MNATPPSNCPDSKEDERRISPAELRTIFAHTQGMLLSQVSSLSDLEGTTIQNWVKRGLVPPPEKKLYELRTVARILIVDLLRDCLNLDHIAFLLGCINGSVTDYNDDLLPEEDLYDLLYDLIQRIDGADLTDSQQILHLIHQHIPKLSNDEEHYRMETAILAMLLAHSSVRLKHLAEANLYDLLEKYPQEQLTVES